ncbi:MAG: MBL fold metallo-hydrolase [Crocinitomicaceae bacterium TMED209]|nr:MAG: MBL fold metallo-hydrolase [Crocinitomicaceae bacterium TMED209]|tara:strand:- start:1758 stop:2627 length:870 start_codon:yes stop_codon:yes gene_type:complete
MQLHTIHTGNFMLDGGAMFGVVPKSLWSRHMTADANNLCSWAMRCLLVENGDNLLLVDTGIGSKQSEKFFSHYHLHGDDSLDRSLAARGFSRADITDVLLTHLHFDHVGGAVERDANGLLKPAFPNAQFWTCERHWDWAMNPNPREKASFLSENLLPLEESGQLRFIDRDGRWNREPFGERFPGLDIFFADGHTESQMLPVVSYRGTRVAYMADLTPAAPHLPMAWVIGYDTRPLLTMEEKALFLDQAHREDWMLFFEHDAVNACCRLESTEKGIRATGLAPSFEEAWG